MSQEVAVSKDAVKKEQDIMMSDYRPSDEVITVTANVQRDYLEAASNRQQTWREFNDKALLDRESIDQQLFNGYVPPKDESEEESWKAQTVRPITRNKVISIAAHVTSVLIAPHVFAQNRDDEEDRDAAVVMEDLMEWANDQADYPKTFVYAVIAALVNPAVIVYVNYQDIKRTIKDILADGSWKKKEIQDEEQSGFKDVIVPNDEFLMPNFYINNVQEQPFLVWERNIDYHQAQFKYGNSEKYSNFDYVKPGKRVVFSEEHKGFYEQEDETLQGRLVHELRYYNKAEDLELIFLNGVLVTHHEQPMARKDKLYPFIKGGYELIDEGKFAYYKSLVSKLAEEQKTIDELWNMILDGTLLAMMPPSALYGDEVVDGSVVVPGGVTTFSNPNTKLEMFYPKGDIVQGLNALRETERSMAEGSSSDLQAGQASDANRTAFEIATIEKNAKVMLGLFGKMIVDLVKQWGKLRMGDILQHLTIGEVGDITAANPLKYKTLFLGDKAEDGQKVTRKIEFTNPGEQVEMKSQNDQLLEELEMLEKAKKSGQKIYKVNPVLFRDLKYKIRYSADVLFQPSSAIERAINLEVYDRAIQNPLANQEAIFRDFLLEQYKPGQAEKYMQDPKKAQQMQMAGKVPPTGMQEELANPQNPNQPQV